MRVTVRPGWIAAICLAVLAGELPNSASSETLQPPFPQEIVDQLIASQQRVATASETLNSQRRAAHVKRQRRTTSSTEAADDGFINKELFVQFTRYVGPIVREALSQFDERRLFVHWLAEFFGRPLQHAVLTGAIPLPTLQGSFDLNLTEPFPVFAGGDALRQEQSFQQWRTRLLVGTERLKKPPIAWLTPPEIKRIRETAPPMDRDVQAILEFDRRVETGLPKEGALTPERWLQLASLPGLIFRQFMWDALSQCESHDEFIAWTLDAYGPSGLKWLEHAKKFEVALPPYRGGGWQDPVFKADFETSYYIKRTVYFRPEEHGGARGDFFHSQHTDHIALSKLAGWGVLWFEPFMGRARAAETASPRGRPVVKRQSPASLGCQVAPDLAQPGRLVVHMVLPASPAEEAGLLPGDHLETFEKQEMSNLTAWERAINAVPADKPFTCQGSRNGTPRTWMMHRAAKEFWGPSFKPIDR